jgi:hypothetical protein
MVVDAAEDAAKPDRAAAISTFVMQAAMSEFACYDEMIIAIFSRSGGRKVAKGLGLGMLRTAFAQPVATNDPAMLTKAEAAAIGLSLEAILRVSETHIEAVDKLLNNYPALGVMREKHV